MINEYDPASTVQGQMEDLKYQIVVDLDKIKKEFANLVSEIRLSLKERISVCDVVTHIISFVSEEDKVILAKETSLNGVFILLTLSNYWSFLDCDILDSIVSIYGSDSDHNKMERYKKSLENFCRRRISEVPGEQLHLNGCDTDSCTRQLLIVKLDMNDPRLSCIKDIKIKFCKILSVMPTEMQIKSIQQGCVEITFFILKRVSEVLFMKPLTEAQCDAFQAVSVVKISCGSFQKLFSVSYGHNIIIQYHCMHVHNRGCASDVIKILLIQFFYYYFF